jgi:hypothetical protein
VGAVGAEAIAICVEALAPGLMVSDDEPVKVPLHPDGSFA